MRHRVAHRKLGRSTPHRMALLRNMATALFERERIRTTLVKAKELRPFAERLITLAKRSDDRLHSRRLVLRDVRDAVVAKKLFDTFGTRFADRPGGYTRILRLGPRKGDGAEMAILELVGSEYQPPKKEEAGKARKDTKAREKTDKGEAKAEPSAKASRAPKTKEKDAQKAKGKPKASARKGGKGKSSDEDS
jgi:large subunit ribosomal protein L17